MCEYLNEPDSASEYLYSAITSNSDYLETVIEEKQNKIEELEELIANLKSEIARLEEIEWMYQDLCE